MAIPSAVTIPPSVPARNIGVSHPREYRQRDYHWSDDPAFRRHSWILARPAVTGTLKPATTFIVTLKCPGVRAPKGTLLITADGQDQTWFRSVRKLRQPRSS